MRVYNKYLICLMALLLVGCGKKKTVKSTSTTATSVEIESENNSTDLEFAEKSVSEEDAASLVASNSYEDLNNKFYFGFDRDSVNNSDKKYLDELVEWLNTDENTGVLVVVYGNCDQRGSASYNMGLGARRANTVKKYLTSNGVSSSRIKVVSLGQTILVEGDSEEAYAKNRVAIVEIEGEKSSIVKKKSAVIETKKSNQKEAVKKTDEKSSEPSDENDDDEDDEDE